MKKHHLSVPVTISTIAIICCCVAVVIMEPVFGIELNGFLLFILGLIMTIPVIWIVSCPILVIIDEDKISRWYFFMLYHENIYMEDISYVYRPARIGRQYRTFDIVCRDGRAIEMAPDSTSLYDGLCTLQEVKKCAGANPYKTNKHIEGSHWCWRTLTLIIAYIVLTPLAMCLPALISTLFGNERLLLEPPYVYFYGIGFFVVFIIVVGMWIGAVQDDPYRIIIDDNKLSLSYLFGPKQIVCIEEISHVNYPDIVMDLQKYEENFIEIVYKNGKTIKLPDSYTKLKLHLYFSEKCQDTVSVQTASENSECPKTLSTEMIETHIGKPHYCKMTLTIMVALVLMSCGFLFAILHDGIKDDPKSIIITFILIPLLLLMIVLSVCTNPFRIIIYDDRLSIQYLFPWGQNKNIYFDDIDYINYPLMIHTSRGPMYESLEIVCKNGKAIELPDSYINLRLHRYMNTILPFSSQ